MKTWKKFLVAAVMFVSVGICTEALAQVSNFDYSPDKPQGYENLWNSMTRKLGRGITNVAFGALEIPISIYNVNFEEGGIAAVTYGTLRGVGYFVLREVVGVVEIATFLVPLPGTPERPQDYKAGYGPILEPEWVITPATNVYNIVFPNTGMYM